MKDSGTLRYTCQSVFRYQRLTLARVRQRLLLARLATSQPRSVYSSGDLSLHSLTVTTAGVWTGSGSTIMAYVLHSGSHVFILGLAAAVCFSIRFETFVRSSPSMSIVFCTGAHSASSRQKAYSLCSTAGLIPIMSSYHPWNLRSTPGFPWSHGSIQ